MYLFQKGFYSLRYFKRSISCCSLCMFICMHVISSIRDHRPCFHLIIGVTFPVPIKLSGGRKHCVLWCLLLTISSPLWIPQEVISNPRCLQGFYFYDSDLALSGLAFQVKSQKVILSRSLISTWTSGDLWPLDLIFKSVLSKYRPFILWTD